MSILVAIKSLYTSITANSIIKFFFFFNDTATTEIYTLSLHDALPISRSLFATYQTDFEKLNRILDAYEPAANRSEEHTSELQSQSNLVCRLLLEKKNKEEQRKES